MCFESLVTIVSGVLSSFLLLDASHGQSDWLVVSVYLRFLTEPD